ncbi:MAG: ribonuclease J [Mycoplasmoidaceae bacterium]
MNENKIENFNEDKKVNNLKKYENGVFIWAMGGLNEIGKNMYIIEDKDEILIIDSGIKFVSQELLGMNGLVPNFQYLQNFKGTINLLITHGHEDHIGGIPYLISKIENIKTIYCPQLPAELVKKKIAEFKLKTPPPIIIYDKDFLIKTNSFEIDFFTVAHSIPHAFGAAIKTKEGIIVTAGDYRFDFGMTGSETDIHKIVEISKRGVDVFLGESTNAETVGFSDTEMIIVKNVLNIIKSSKGRVFLSTFASNLGRIEKILAEVENLNRKICLMGRSMENNVRVFKQLGLLNIKESNFISAKEITTVPDDELLVILTGSQGEERAALNRIANDDFPKVSFKPSDTVILSSNPIPGNFLNVENLVNSLHRSGAKIYRHTASNKIHASGHATASEMQLMFNIIKPKYIIPIHGEYKMLKSSQKNANSEIDSSKNVIIIANGQKVFFKNHIPQMTDIWVDVTANIIDGKSISSDSEKILQERIDISNDGIFSITLVISKANNNLVTNPTVSTRGVIIVKNSIPLISKISYSVKDEIEKALHENSNVTEKILSDIAKEVINFFIWKNYKKTPLVEVIIFYV